MLALIGWTQRNFHLIRYPEREWILLPGISHSQKQKIPACCWHGGCTLVYKSVHWWRWPPCSLTGSGHPAPSRPRSGCEPLWVSPCHCGAPQLSCERVVLTGVMASHVIRDRNGQEALSVNAAHEGDDLYELPGHLSYLRLVMELSVA